MNIVKPMQEYTPAQWILISLATHHGMDKDTYPERLAWGREVLTEVRKAKTFEDYKALMHPYIDTADVPEEFASCCLALWDTLQGEETGYVLGLDACNSGAQIMSCMGRCIVGMQNTGLIDMGYRPDLYQAITDGVDGFDADRSLVKKGAVPHLYGSKAEPKNIFGEALYDAFLASCNKVMPMVEWIKDTLIACWNSEALEHTFYLPDGGVACIKVIKQSEYQGKFNDFHYSFHVDENTPKAFGDEGTTSLAAHVIHSFDAYILRELERRCDYNAKQLKYAKRVLNNYLLVGESDEVENAKLVELCNLSNVFNMTSMRGIEFVVDGELGGITPKYALALLEQIDQVLYQDHSFNLRNIHDEFGCHPNHANSMRRHYNQIMLETYRSTWLFDTIQLLSGVSYHHTLPDTDPYVEQCILNNNYSIC